MGSSSLHGLAAGSSLGSCAGARLSGDLPQTPGSGKSSGISSQTSPLFTSASASRIQGDIPPVGCAECPGPGEEVLELIRETSLERSCSTKLGVSLPKPGVPSDRASAQPSFRTSLILTACSSIDCRCSCRKASKKWPLGASGALDMRRLAAGRPAGGLLGPSCVRLSQPAGRGGVRGRSACCVCTSTARGVGCGESGAISAAGRRTCWRTLNCSSAWMRREFLAQRVHVSSTARAATETSDTSGAGPGAAAGQSTPEEESESALAKAESAASLRASTWLSSIAQAASKELCRGPLLSPPPWLLKALFEAAPASLSGDCQTPLSSSSDQAAFGSLAPAASAAGGSAAVEGRSSLGDKPLGKAVGASFEERRSCDSFPKASSTRRPPGPQSSAHTVRHSSRPILGVLWAPHPIEHGAP
mmetsp:Transcript_7109/g.15328  ORF Transcript_7109/g.15328 Transcript_7109/m.15328 type:complete len:417 (-) Transcript_7109:60-1310(-)